MSWLRKMFGQEQRATPHRVIAPEEREELEAAREKHVRLLGRADEAIKEAMAHADEVFGYRGPDRRSRPR